ncbi:MAG: hypothetical protein AAGU77_06215, partial [Bacillota bacterium]
MKNYRRRFFKLFRLSWLILPCMLLSGCLFGPNGCGAPPPQPDTKNLLTIHLEAGASMVCYDDSGYYFLRERQEGMQVCHAKKTGEAEVLCSLYYAWGIASWGDKLVVDGWIDEQGETGLLVMDKQAATRDQILVYDEEQEREFHLRNGTVVTEDVLLPPLHRIFNESTANIPFDRICKEQVRLDGVSNLEDYSKTNWRAVFQALDMEIKMEYHFSIPEHDWVIQAGGWVYCFSSSDDNGKTEYYPSEYYYIGSASGAADLCLYDDQPYFVEHDYVGRARLWPSMESGKADLLLGAGKGYWLRRHFHGKNERMQYFVFTSYDEEQPQNYYDDMYDLQFLTGHKIYAVDLETMQQTKELTLSTPHEQVLYVNEAGAYTWRQEECRVFFTPWEGEPVPASDVIPYVPRYETS